MLEMNYSRIYSITLFLLTFIIWYAIYSAQFLLYDENWGNILTTFFISIFTFIGILILFWKKRDLLRKTRWQTIAFLLLASPLTIYLVVDNYELIFGVALKK